MVASILLHSIVPSLRRGDEKRTFTPPPHRLWGGPRKEYFHAREVIRSPLFFQDKYRNFFFPPRLQSAVSPSFPFLLTIDESSGSSSFFHPSFLPQPSSTPSPCLLRCERHLEPFPFLSFSMIQFFWNCRILEKCDFDKAPFPLPLS